MQGSGVDGPVYFGDFVTQHKPLPDSSNVVLELCGTYDSSSPTNINESLSSYFDAMNFIWFQGAESPVTQGPGNFLERDFLEIYSFRPYLSLSWIYASRPAFMLYLRGWILPAGEVLRYFTIAWLLFTRSNKYISE